MAGLAARITEWLDRKRVELEEYNLERKLRSGDATTGGRDQRREMRRLMPLSRLSETELYGGSFYPFDKDNQQMEGLPEDSLALSDPKLLQSANPRQLQPGIVSIGARLYNTWTKQFLDRKEPKKK